MKRSEGDQQDSYHSNLKVIGENRLVHYVPIGLQFTHCPTHSPTRFDRQTYTFVYTHVYTPLALVLLHTHNSTLLAEGSKSVCRRVVNTLMHLMRKEGK